MENQMYRRIRGCHFPKAVYARPSIISAHPKQIEYTGTNTCFFIIKHHHQEEDEHQEREDQHNPFEREQIVRINLIMMRLEQFVLMRSYPTFPNLFHS
jgi:hypothetical protein